MFQQTFAIIRNTFFESIRQPVLLVVLVAATIAIILSNPLSAFTMSDDQRMLIDIGLATVFLAGTVLAAFIATNVLGEEIENRTALTVISKPVYRVLFVLGKYLGVAGALALSTAYLAFVFLLVEQHAVIQTARDPVHLPVWTFGFFAGVIGVGVAVWCNYFYNKVFTSTVICIVTPLAGLAYVLSMMFRPDFSSQSISIGFNGQVWIAMGGLFIAIMVLTAIAVAASTRLGQVMTLSVTLGAFILGMLSDWFFGRHINAMRDGWTQEASAQGLTEMVTRTQTVELMGREGTEIQEIVNQVEVATVPLFQFAGFGEKIEYLATWLAYAVVPNFQVMLLSDAVTQGHRIPLSYLGITALYGLAYIFASLSVATILFQRREVG